MDAALFDERAADQQVIKSLSNEIERLKAKYMSKIIKSVDGKFYRVHSFEEVSQDEVNAELDSAKQEVAALEQIVTPADAVAPAADVLLSETPMPVPAVPAPANPVAADVAAVQPDQPAQPDATPAPVVLS